MDRIRKEDVKKGNQPQLDECVRHTVSLSLIFLTESFVIKGCASVTNPRKLRRRRGHPVTRAANQRPSVPALVTRPTNQKTCVPAPLTQLTNESRAGHQTHNSGEKLNRGSQGVGQWHIEDTCPCFKETSDQ